MFFNIFLRGFIVKHTNNTYRLGFSTLLMLVLGFVFIACKGPEGPAGTNGTNGKDGSNGTAGCVTCHNNSANLVAKANEYDQSVHSEGLVYEYANRTACAMCHTHEGFLESMASGLDTVYAAPGAVAPYANPSTIQCRTCHMIHTKYDSTDWKFRNVTPFTTVFSGHTQTIDIGTGNLCGRCHQSRAMSPAMPTTDSVAITSSRWYPHHGGQSSVLAGQTAYDLGVGGTLVSAQAHQKISNTCVRCHMSALPNVEVRGIGGHSFGIASTDPTTFVKTTSQTGCMSGDGENCHAAKGAVGADAKFNPTDYPGSVDKMTADIMLIRTTMASKGWLDTTGTNFAQTHSIKNDLIKATTKAPLKLKLIEAKALVNYFIVNQDQSWGVHNPKYVKSIIAQIKAVLGL